MIEAAVLFSGGKDSVYATYIAQQQSIDIKTTLTLVPADPDSYMFHVPNASWAATISSAMGLPNRTVFLSGDEDELGALSELIGSLGVDVVITGAIASDYQSSRINQICEPMNVRVFSPLWHKCEERLLGEMIDAGFTFVMIGASADGIEERWLGREFNREMVDDLRELSRKRHIHLSGEGGEFETVVLDGPNFRKAIRLISTGKSWQRDSGFMNIRAIRLLEKSVSDDQ